MKLLIFNLIFLLISCIPSYGAQPESAAANDSSFTQTRRWDKRVHLKYKGWQQLKPTHIKLNGNMPEGWAYPLWG